MKLMIPIGDASRVQSVVRYYIAFFACTICVTWLYRPRVNSQVKSLLALSLLIACGPNRRDQGNGSGSGSGSGSGIDTCTVNCATVTGRVFAPKWAAGDVPQGQEI